MSDVLVNVLQRKAGNYDRRGGTLIALSNATKQIEMMIGIDQLDPSFVCFKSFREKVFSCMSQTNPGSQRPLKK